MDKNKFLWTEDDLIINRKKPVAKGGPGSGNYGHAGIPGVRGGSMGRGGGRVWGGSASSTTPTLSRLEAGALGEQMAAQALGEVLGAEFSTLNVGMNNAPIDLAGDHAAVEVKTGLSSNGETAQHWRATIGQPGKAETEMLKKMTSEEKKAWNQAKSDAILERKSKLLKKMSNEAGAEIKPYTAGVILSPDGSQADVYLVPDFHLRLPWKDYATDEYYVGTYNVNP